MVGGLVDKMGIGRWRQEVKQVICNQLRKKNG